MVAIAIEPHTGSMSSQRRAFIFTLVLQQIIAHKHLIIIILQTRAVVAHQSARHYYLVEEIPFALIHQSALPCLVERVPEGVEHIGVALDVLFAMHSAKTFGNALIFRIIVEVAHYYHMRIWVEAKQRIFHSTHLHASPFAHWALRPSRWPMVDNHVHHLAPFYGNLVHADDPVPGGTCGKSLLS